MYDDTVKFISIHINLFKKEAQSLLNRLEIMQTQENNSALIKELRSVLTHCNNRAFYVRTPICNQPYDLILYLGWLIS